MIRHSKIRMMLYEYAQGDLPQEKNTEIETHLRSCRRCAEELGRVRTALSLMAPPAIHPSEERPAEFWNRFVDGVEGRIRQAEAPGFGKLLRERFRSVHPRTRHAYALGGALAVVVAAVLMWPRQSPPEVQPSRVAGETPSVSAPVPDDPLGQYLRRTKSLLVGLSNMNARGPRTMDLSVQREASRQLLRESRSLRQEPLDGRASRLITNVDKILVELANADEPAQRRNVERLQSGIRQENLLFKIRMAEQTYSRGRVMTASYSK